MNERIDTNAALSELVHRDAGTVSRWRRRADWPFRRRPPWPASDVPRIKAWMAGALQENRNGREPAPCPEAMQVLTDAYPEFADAHRLRDFLADVAKPDEDLLRVAMENGGKNS